MSGISFGGLTVEFTMLALAIILGFVHMLAATLTMTRERGLWWNIGPRDNAPPPESALAGRFVRAFANFRETFPFFAASVLALGILGRHNAQTMWGSELYVAGRVLYLPLYAAGIPVVRTVVWAIATIGIGLLLAALLGG